MKRFTMWTVLATIVLIISVSTAGCTSNVANQTSNVGTQTTSAVSRISSVAANMSAYTSENFTILYPISWINASNKARTLDTFSVTCRTGNNAFLGAVASNASVPIDFNRLTSSHVADLRNRSGVSVIETGNATLAGRPAYKVVYTETVSGATQKTMEIVTVKGTSEYIITYRARPADYDAYLDTAQQMIDSFVIT